MAVHSYLRAEAFKCGFDYDSFSDQWVSKNGTRIANINDERKMLELMRQSYQLSNLGAGSAVNYTAGTIASAMPRKRSPYEKLAVRMDMDAGESFPFEHCHIIETSTEVYILIKNNDQVVLLHDGKDLFPSDELLGKIRLLQ